MLRARVGLSFSLVAVFLGLMTRHSFGEITTPPNLAVTIQGLKESGIRSAHLYIFSENKKVFFGARETSERANLYLPAGDYRVYAAVSLNVNGTIDHYSSPEARIHLDAQEPTSVILSLQKAEGDDPEISPTSWNVAR